MENSQDKIRQIAAKLPNCAGIYKFLDNKGKILYIGKATSLKSRVQSYFAKNLDEKRSPLIERMVEEAKIIKFEKTDSVLEALILEAELIKKYLPEYNSVGKDQKSWNYVVITNEKFPRVLVMREREIEVRDTKYEIRFGPFTNGGQLRVALKIIRKIFPFRDNCSENQSEPCFNSQIGLCPGTCINKISEKDYKTTIRHITDFFRGKKKKIIRELGKEMKSLAKERRFEEAEEVKRKVFALKHIEDIALIKRDRPELQNSYSDKKIFRIEAYDIAHISGTHMVGVMVVVEDGEPKKSGYRMFKIRGQKTAGDSQALEEVLDRRLNHKEWPLPDLVVVDGGVAQQNTAKLVLEGRRLKIQVAAVVKDDRHRPKKVVGPEELKKQIILANSEAHRFALKFHRKLRDRI